MPQFLKLILYILTVVATVVVLSRYVNVLATHMQQAYIRAGKEMYGTSFPWETSWVRTMFKAMIIFSGVCLASIAFALLFGPIML